MVITALLKPGRHIPRSEMEPEENEAPGSHYIPNIYVDTPMICDISSSFVLKKNLNPLIPLYPRAVLLKF